MSEINWSSLLEYQDVEGLWNGLYQIVSRHPAVRPLHFATDGAAVVSPFEINADLTQELFLELFQKQRFEHYLYTGYSSADIENEIAHIELPNLVGARLRKRYPESFRMARRVSALLKSSPRFRRMSETDDEAEASPKPKRGRPPKAAKQTIPANPQAEEDDDLEAIADFAGDELPNETAPATPKRQRMVNQVYGLKEWKSTKPMRDSGHFGEFIRNVPMRKRDTRVVGRSGTSQLILSNPELENLMIEIFEAIDSPADVRTIRQLALAKIPLQDYNIASLDEEFSAPSGNGSMMRRDPADTRGTAEDVLLREEKNRQAADLAGNFLHSLRKAVNNNERRYDRLLSTLWHCFYNPENPSQLEIADTLGVSDSLVSDNRRLIEHELKKLRLSVEEGAVFSESLRMLIEPNGLIN
ncbi:MAG: hypothetical protein AB1757_01235 [Acidobacteriota bacterium]